MKWLMIAVGLVVGSTYVEGQAGATMIMENPSASWVIEAADYTGEVKDQILRMEARYTIQVLRDGWTQIPLSLPGAAITAITIQKKSGDAHIVPDGTGYQLTVSRKGTYRVQVKFSNRLVQDSQFEGLQFPIPQATFSTLTLFIPRKDVELRQADQLYVDHQAEVARNGVKLTARLGASDRVDVRWRTKPTTPVKIEPVFYGEVHTLVTVEEQLARVLSIIEYRIAQGETKELQITLPAGLNVLNVRGAGIDDWRVAEEKDHKTLTVALGMALKETTYRLAVEAEQTLGEGATSYRLPEIQVIGVKQERGYVAVARAGSIELTPQTVEGINRVDVRELPEELRASAGAPIMLAFKYQQHPYVGTLTLTHHQDHAVLAAIAERAELVTVLSRQGELLTRASYFIRANKKQFLEVLLPDGATLWSCIVDGRSVKPVEGTDKRLLIPMDMMVDSTQAVSVELVYFERRHAFERIGHLTLQGPILDVPSTISNWSVYAPRELRFFRMSGNLEKGIAPVEFVDEPMMQVVLAAAPASSVSDSWKVAERQARDASSRPYAQDDMRGDVDNGEVNNAVVMGRTEQYEAYYSEGRGGEFPRKTRLGGLLDKLGNKKENEPASEEGKQKDGNLQEFISSLENSRGETGILPLKIQVPKAGTVYHFNRLMTTQDALTLDTTFVHLPMPWLPFAAFGLLLMPIGGLTIIRFRRT